MNCVFCHVLNQNADFIEVSDLAMHTKIQVSEFDKLIEIKNYYFLKLKSGMSLIIPKRVVLDREAFLNIFSDSDSDIEYLEELDWEWK